MKRILALLLACCMIISVAAAETEATPSDMEPAAETPTALLTQPTPGPDAEPDAPEEAPAVTEPDASATETPVEATKIPFSNMVTTIAPQPTATPEPVSQHLYVLVDGVKQYGEADELIPLGRVIYLCDKTVTELVGYTAGELAKVAFALDPEVFTNKNDCIYLSVQDPDGREKEGTFFLWAGRKGSLATATPLPISDEVVEHEILVTPMNYSATEACIPVFALACAPEMEAGMQFAVIVDDGEPRILEGDHYMPDASGSYRFALLAADGTVLHRSARFSVTLPASNSNQASNAKPTPAATQAPADDPTLAPECTAAPTGASLLKPTPAVTQVPSADPTETPTAAPETTAAPTRSSLLKPTSTTQSPAATPTAAPTMVPPVEVTAAPTASPDAQPTLALSNVKPTPAPSEAVTAAPSPEPEVTEAPMPPDTDTDPQAWTIAGDLHIEGDLADMLQSDGDVIYILTERIIVLDGGYAQLAGKTLLPDPQRFGDGYVVRIASESQDVAREDSLFVWVEAKGAAAATSVAMTVDAECYVEGAWSGIVPSFILTAEPALETLEPGYVWAVSVDAGAPVMLSGSVYAAAEEGAYTMQFLLLAPDGSVAARSGSYSVQLDYTAPLVQVKSGNGSLQITVGDALSGGDAVSLDGGLTWLPLTQGEGGVSTYTHTVTEAQIIPAGSIRVRDKAGNANFYPEDVSINVSSGGGRGGSGRTTSHSASTEDSVTVYNGVELVLDGGSMTQLVIGDETLDLLLTYTGDEAQAPEDAPGFTADFTDLDQDGEPDTLQLVAAGVEDALAADYTWCFSGLVCKKLSASGIDYMLLRTGSQVTVLTTAGFTAGLRYNMHRAEGLVSKDFSYALCMDAQSGLNLQVSVGGACYLMSADPTAEMYYYDLFCGSLEEFEEAVRMYRSEVLQ